MKGVFILYGESFRDGGQFSRITATKRSLPLQIKASKSHMDFCKFVKKQYNIDLDIIIHTYATKYEHILKKIYNNPQYISSKELIGNTNCAQMAVDLIKKEYDFVFFTRMDIYIKPQFYTLFNPYWNKINFLSQNFTSWECGFYPKNYPIINPIIKFIPKKYFKVLKKIDIGHSALKSYIEYFKLTYDDFDFMVDEYYDANTYNDYNPYYKMISRPESKKHIDKGKKINRLLFGTRKKITCKKVRIRKPQ